MIGIGSVRPRRTAPPGASLQFELVPQGRWTGRAVGRFITAVMITSGLLMVADAVLTVTWQEPVSALLAGREQGRLDEQLASATRRSTRERRTLGSRRQDGPAHSALAARAARRLETGDAVGRIVLPTLRRSYVVIEGTDVDTLRKGPGHYPDTPLPGQRGTVAIAGHRTTHGAPFRSVDRLRPGDRIVTSMPYGRFTYRVETTRIVAPTALWVKRRVAHDRLILTACHPLYSAEQRIVVFARLQAARPASRVA